MGAKLWLQGRENGIANLETLRLTAADVEKQAEKTKVRFMDEDGNTVDNVNGNPVADDDTDDHDETINVDGMVDILKFHTPYLQETHGKMTFWIFILENNL